MSSWPSWPAGCRHRWRRWLGCSPRRCATWAMPWRRSRSRNRTRRPRPDRLLHRSITTHTEKETSMAVLTQDDLLEAIDKMTVLELSEFIKRFEERYGVTAAAPAAVAAPAAGGGGGDAAAPAAAE